MLSNNAIRVSVRGGRRGGGEGLCARGWDGGLCGYGRDGGLWVWVGGRGEDDVGVGGDCVRARV